MLARLDAGLVPLRHLASGVFTGVRTADWAAELAALVALTALIVTMLGAA